MRKPPTPPEKVEELAIHAQALLKQIEKFDGMTLSDCLRCFVKGDLTSLIDYNEYAVKPSLKKNDLIGQLDEEIVERFRAYIKNMPIEEYLRLNLCLGANESELDEDLYMMALPYHMKGFLYFFESMEAKVTKLVFPKELMEMLLQEITTENIERFIKRQMMVMIMEGLAAIYGVYTRSQLLKVWEMVYGQEQEQTLGLEYVMGWGDVGQIIEECIAFSKISEMVFETVSGYIMMYGLSEDNYFKEILEGARGKDYYMPPIEEIMYYSENQFDVESGQYKQLRQFLVKKANLDEEEIEDLMDEVCSILATEAADEDVMEAVWAAGVDLSERDAKKLRLLTNDLASNTRNWLNKGYKPNELANFSQNRPQRAPGDNVIPFPVERTKKPPQN